MGRVDVDVQARIKSRGKSMSKQASKHRRVCDGWDGTEGEKGKNV